MYWLALGVMIAICVNLSENVGDAIILNAWNFTWLCLFVYFSQSHATEKVQARFCNSVYGAQQHVVTSEGCVSGADFTPFPNYLGNN